jgi:hypothetical protein
MLAAAYVPVIVFVTLLIAARSSHARRHRLQAAMSAHAKFPSGSVIRLPPRPITTGLVGSERRNPTRKDQSL